MYCIVCRYNPSLSLDKEYYAEEAQFNTTSLERLHVTLQSINNPLSCGKYEQKGTICRCTLELKLPVIAMVCSCCAYDFIAIYIKSKAKSMQDLEIKFYQLLQDVLLLADQYYVSSNHVKPSYMVLVGSRNP